MMKHRIDCLSLPADDLGRVITFYRDGLGWPMEDIGRDADHIALTLQGGSYLVFIQRADSRPSPKSQSWRRRHAVRRDVF
jgi:predicted enzyme related to lactoylglutathione lyase